ncbi:DUF4382 domain-containing protein [Haloarcula marina]|uniref:DUF4382 domain-containing protein n=1 Tax=Haloarcula marina TaxID=2961574 RepID=UPI0020B67F10|nr:DUF4382 domain-containing protein [Halomicroarcula marina]
MDRRTYLQRAGTAVSVAAVAGCTGDSGGDSESGATESSDDTGDQSGDGTTYGTLATSVTDQPSDIGDFESCVVTLEGMWLVPASDDATETDGEGTESETEMTDTESETADTETETATTTATGSTTDTGTDTETETATETTTDAETDDSDGGRRYVAFEEPQRADLVDLQGNNTQLLDEIDVRTGEYRFLQLAVTGVEGVLTDGTEASVDTPGNAPLKFNHAFEIRADERTHFVADFTPVKRGNGSYLIRPVATGTTVLYGDEEYTAEASASTTADETATGTDSAETETETTTATETATDDGPGNSGGNGNRQNGN